MHRLGIRNIVFWNVDARVKLLLAKVLPPGGVRLVDVSPGPYLFHDLDRNASFQWRIAFDRAGYFDRLDHFVATYADVDSGILDARRPSGRVVAIPNAVPDMASTSVDRAQPLTPPGVDADLVIGTCGPIVPASRLEFLIDVMAELGRRLPGVTMVVVGAAPPMDAAYWESLQEHMRGRGVANMHFVGYQADVVPFLRLMRVFVMVSNNRGSPHAALEAMSLGLPIVTNRDGAMAAQVEHGVNGFLVSDRNPKDMAHRVRMLLSNSKLRRGFGAAGRKIVGERFSMERIVDR